LGRGERGWGWGRKARKEDEARKKRRHDTSKRRLEGRGRPQRGEKGESGRDWRKRGGKGSKDEAERVVNSEEYSG